MHSPLASANFCNPTFHRHYRLPQALKGTHPPVDVVELRVAVRMLLAFQRLAVGLQAVAQLVQQPVHRPFADRVTGSGQFRRQARRAAAGPQQRPHRVAAGDRIDQPLQRVRQGLIMCSQSGTDTLDWGGSQYGNG